MPSSFGYVFNLASPTASDVATHEITATTSTPGPNPGDPPTVNVEVRSYPVAATLTDKFVFATGDSVALVEVQIDQSGNRSAPSGALIFDVVDDVPPPQPGSLSVATKTQEP